MINDLDLKFGDVRDWNFHKDLFDQREFHDAGNMAHLALMLRDYKGIKFSPYTIEETFVSALDTYGLRVDGATYAIHPILKTLFTFTSENSIN